MDELNITNDQLKRMRSMNKFYHHQFLIDVRIFFTLGLITLIFSLFNAKIVYVLPFLSLFGSVILAFHAYYLIFSRHYSEYLEKNINKISKNQVFITHELENRYFFPINDKKSATIISEYDGAPSGRYPMYSFALNGSDLILILLIKISPLSGSKKPVSIFIVVDFPAPFGPRKPTTSPLDTDKSILSTAIN